MELYIVFRMPKFPVIIVRGDTLFSAASPKSLVNVIAQKIQDVKNERTVFIDSTGEEFSYFDEMKSLAPALIQKKWPKKKIIELYNSSTNAKKRDTSYSEKSLSAKPYQKIFKDIAELIRKNHP